MSPSLPEEYVKRSLAMLNPTQVSTIPTLLNARLVCKSWNQLAQDAKIWEALLVNRWHTTPNHAEQICPHLMDKYERRHKLDRKAASLIRVLSRATHSRTFIIARLCSHEFGLQIMDELSKLSEMREENDPLEWMAMRHWALVVSTLLTRQKAMRQFLGGARAHPPGKHWKWIDTFIKLLIPFLLAFSDDVERARCGLISRDHAMYLVECEARYSFSSFRERYNLSRVERGYLKPWEAFVAQSAIAEFLPSSAWKCRTIARLLVDQGEDEDVTPWILEGTWDVGTLLLPVEDSLNLGLCVVLGKGFTAETGELVYHCFSASGHIYYGTPETLRPFTPPGINHVSPGGITRVNELCQHSIVWEHFLRIESKTAPIRLVPNNRLAKQYPTK